MKLGKRDIRLPRLSGVALWAPIAGLLFFGVITTLVDFYQLPSSEIQSANEASQRFVIDLQTGDIVLGKTHSTADHAEPAEQFDVAKPEEAGTTPNPDAAAEAPADEHATEPAAAPTDAPSETTTPEAHDDAVDGHAETPEASHTETPAPAEVTPEAATPAAPHAAKAKPATETPAEKPHAEETKPAATAAEAAKPAEIPNAEASIPKDMPTLRTEPIAVDLTAPPHTKDSLVGAPAPEVTETVDGMKLPKRGDKDVLPSKLYAQPFTRKDDQVLLSFVVMDVGIDPQSIGLAMALPKEVSVAYSPYVRKDMSYSEHIRALGHEVWTMMPTMNDRYPNDDPGPMGLLAKMPVEEMIRRLRLVLGVVPGSLGLVLTPNETITLKRNELEPVLAEINKRGLLLLSTHPQRSIDQITTDKTLNSMIRRADLVLDPEPNETQIRSKLAGLVAAATDKGEYLVVLSSRPQSLQLLAEWLKENPPAAPITLAPLSAMYQPKEAAEPKAEAASGGHGGGEKKKEKAKPAPKKQKPLPQDKYLKPAGGEGGHGGGEKKSGGH